MNKNKIHLKQSQKERQDNEGVYNNSILYTEMKSVEYEKQARLKSLLATWSVPS